MCDTIRRWRATAAALVGLTVATAAWSEPAPPFAQLLRQAYQSPRIEAIQAEISRAEGLAVQARARPNPTISLYGENFGGSSPYGGFGRTETTLQLNQPLEIGGKRSARIEAGRAGVVAAQMRSADERLTYAWQLAHAYADAEIAQRRVALAEDEVEEAGDVLKVARALVAAGKEARLRAVQSQSELQTQMADLAAAKAGYAGALARLSAMAGRAVPYTALGESLLDRLEARPASGPIDPLQVLAVRAADAEREAAARRVVAQRKVAVPDITAQIGVRRLELDDATAIVAGVSLPLNIFDRNRGNVQAAEADLRGAEARANAVRLETHASMEATLALMEASDLRAAAAADAMKTAEESYRLARIAYEAGKSPLIELLTVRHGLGAARGAVLDAAAARLDARASLARLRGVTITGEPVQ